jgi:hypothetical protein
MQFIVNKNRKASQHLMNTELESKYIAEQIIDRREQPENLAKPEEQAQQ